MSGGALASHEWTRTQRSSKHGEPRTVCPPAQPGVQESVLRATSIAGCRTPRARRRSTTPLGTHTHALACSHPLPHTHTLTLKRGRKKTCPGSYIHRQQSAARLTALLRAQNPSAPHSHTPLTLLSLPLAHTHIHTRALMLQHLFSLRGRRGAKAARGGRNYWERNGWKRGRNGWKTEARADGDGSSVFVQSLTGGAVAVAMMATCTKKRTSSSDGWEKVEENGRMREEDNE